MRAAGIAGYRGLIGHSICRSLEAAGWDVRRFGRGNPLHGEFVPIDLDVGECLRASVFSGCDFFVHAAGVVDEDLKTPESAAAAETRAKAGTEALLEVLREAGVSHLVYISSAHVYGPLEGRIDEDSRANPLSPYAKLHFATETRVRDAVERGLLQSALILRPCAVYGMPPDMTRFRRWSLIPYSFPREAGERGSITLQSAGVQMRNFVSTEAIAGAVAEYARRIEAGAATGVRLENTAGEETLSIIAFAKRVAAIYTEVTGKPCEVRVPESVNVSVSAPLEYASLAPHARGEALDDYLRTMIRALSEHAA